MRRKKPTKKQLAEATARVRRLAKAGKVVLATHTRIDECADVAEDFMLNVVGIKCWLITDESSLYDFTVVPKSILRARVKQRYGIMLAKGENPFLADLFERIKRQKSN
mgnify:CR=1 FL=1